jgi:hypothetical protein
MAEEQGMTDNGPRSAYEIAMERLRHKDAEKGIEEKPRTDAQKAEIAEVGTLYASRLAQEELMHQSRIVGLSDPSARQALDDEYYRERQRLIAERDRKIERIRRGELEKQ